MFDYHGISPRDSCGNIALVGRGAVIMNGTWDVPRGYCGVRTGRVIQPCHQSSTHVTLSADHHPSFDLSSC